MGYPLDLAARYMRAKKTAFVSVGTAFAILGVALGVAALATVMAVTGGFQAQFRDKVLGVNAHVLVLKYSSDFREYRDVMASASSVPGVTGVAPFTINPMMVTHGARTATGVLLKGVDPELMPSVLDVPKHIVDPKPEGGDAAAQKRDVEKVIATLRRPGAEPPTRAVAPLPTLPTLPMLPPDVPPAPLGAAGANGSLHGPGLALSGTPSAGALPSGAAAHSGTPSAGPLSSSAPAHVATPSASAGVIDPDDALAPTRDEPLLRAIRQAIAESDAKRAAAKSNGVEPASSASAAPAIALAPGAPRGDVEPEGGYKSELPSDDELPSDVVPDPCGDAASVAKLPGAIVGVTLAKNLELTRGDCLQVTSPTIGYSYSNSAIRPPVAKQFRVVAIFDAGFDQYDSKLVYTDVYEAQAFYDMGDSVTGVEMKVDDIESAKAVAHAIDQKLANPIYHTMDWEELNHGLFTALRIQQIGMSAVLALIIVVAAFTVIATLIMVVLDKKKEIAVLKAMGATDDAILRTFLYQGGFIGLVGTAAGLGAGYLVCKVILVYGFKLDPKVYFISELPVDLRPVEFFLTGAIAIVICLVATIPPALYAAWLRPTEGLRDT